MSTNPLALAYEVMNTVLDCTKAFENHFNALKPEAQKELLVNIEKILQPHLREEAKVPEPLFTRTVYSVADLHAQIDAIEALGFTSYVIGRDVEHRTKRDMFLSRDVPDDRDRWIIKVYGEVTE